MAQRNGADFLDMLWWFERVGKRTTIKVLPLAAGEYELGLLGADGVERVEHFTIATDLANRQQAIQGSLAAEG